MRAWARWLSSWGAGREMKASLGLTDENGKFVWEDASKEGGHEFRSYLYEKMRYRTQTDGENATNKTSPYG